MKVRETDSERGRSTTAWFTSFSGEMVQAMIEPAIPSPSTLPPSHDLCYPVIGAR
jgi:hypothetical protein